MNVAKRSICVAALGLAAILTIRSGPDSQAGPAVPEPVAPRALARADLAEAVFTMVLENAANAGMRLSQPPTLCQACVAAHLGQPEHTIRDRCGLACGLR